MNKGLTYLLLGLALILIILLGVSATLLIQQDLRAAERATASPTAEPVAELPTATATTEPVRELPAPQMEILPTNTPEPTNTPTETAVPTDTPAPTDTPQPTATPVPPVVIVPNTPVPPTNTPPPPTAVPQDTRGLSATFSLEAGPNFGANQEIWFNFNVSNATGSPVHFDVLGVYPRKDGNLRADLIQASWGGQPSDAVPPGGLIHRDNIKIGESGSYTLQLAICFDASYAACRAGGGTWVFLSGQIPITIN
jgi:hypothetical protein